MLIIKVKKIFAVFYRGAISVTHVHPSVCAGSNMDSWSTSFYSQSAKEC